MNNDRKTALVMNARDYAGPAAVTALTSANFRVLVCDEAFADEDAWSEFSSAHPTAERLLDETPDLIVGAAWKVAGRVDAIVSNDYFPAIHNSLEQASAEDLLATLGKLVVAPFMLVKAAVPRLKTQGGGNVVMITSCRTRLPMPGGAIPDAARAAANALVRSFSVELAPLGIAVNAVAPNFFYSEAYYPRSRFIDDPAGRAFVASEVPVGRLGSTEEMGELICFLASTEARFLTGSIIDFAGGWPAAKIRPLT
ncbi:3-oxoacyl-[acyl-carrier protein] reductase [Paraburkholderia sp. GAS448]|jgi:3-oxoacyl-[acyl-carrier protein] reductase|uniref:SDR family oxidoreductase n=1 Tax=Paraburkholderia sp. GAS448 TaxID=3035136 RepID=UPI003D19D9C9